MNTKAKLADKTKVTRKKPASNAMFLVTKKEDQTRNDGFPADFQDLCSLAMDRAIGIEKASLRTVVDLHSSAIEIYKNAFWFAPAFGELLDTVAESFTYCMELQVYWLTLMAPHVNEEAEALLPLATPSSKVAIGSGKKRQYRHRARAKAA